VLQELISDGQWQSEGALLCSGQPTSGHTQIQKPALSPYLKIQFNIILSTVHGSMRYMHGTHTIKTQWKKSICTLNVKTLKWLRGFRLNLVLTVYNKTL
jgi:hypothetical protein